MKLTTKIRMDLEKPGSTPIIHGVQSDSCIKRLEIALYRDRMPCVLSENFRVLVRYRKPNKMGGEYDTLPDGTSAWNIWGNRVTLSLVPQLFTTPGTVSLTVTLIGDGGQFSLYPILLFVQSVACADIAESENYFYVTGFLPAPRTANAGNYLRVGAVDDEGKITRIEAVKVSVPEDLQGPDISLQEQSEGVLIRIDHPDGSVQSSLVRHGTSGKQPVRGQDYWTESDIEGIKAYVDEAILGGAW